MVLYGGYMVVMEVIWRYIWLNGGYMVLYGGMVLYFSDAWG